MVICPMQIEPFRIDMSRIGVDLGGLQPMKSGNNLRFPCHAAVGDRITQSHRLDLGSNVRQVVQIADRQANDAETALWIGYNKSLFPEPGQSLPHDRQTDAESVAQLGDLELAARLYSRVEDVGTQRFVYITGACRLRGGHVLIIRRYTIFVRMSIIVG